MSKKIILLVFLAGIATLIFGLIAMRTLKPEENKFSQNEQEQKTETINQTKKGVENYLGSDEIEEIDTSNWKTYRNEEFGFEFQYPKDWIITLSETSESLALSFSAKLFKSPTKRQPQFVISINPESWFFKPYMEHISTEDTAISNYKFTKIIFHADNDPALGCDERGIKGYQLYLTSKEKRSEKNIRIWGSTCKDELFFMTTLEGILSSLRIIN